MMQHSDINKEALRKKIDSGEITLGGNGRLKIYGQLNCSSGKRMLKRNRVFFKDEKEAKVLGFRPCGHCLFARYQAWKALNT